MIKKLAKIIYNGKEYYGKLIKLDASYQRCMYNEFCNSDPLEFATRSKITWRDEVHSRFGDGIYKFHTVDNSQKDTLTCCWMEIDGLTYSYDISKFTREFAQINHERLQITEIKSLKNVINTMRSRGLSKEVKRIENLLNLDKELSQIRLTYLRSLNIFNKLIK